MMATAVQAGRGTHFVVATPIGNLEDITYRAVRVLQDADLVAAEDTRHSRKLLDYYGIRTPLLSYHEHNEQQRQPQLLERLGSGEVLALISDAGTPCIADPGYRLVQACHAAGITVVPVPGASALIAALSVAGAPTDRFVFEGYLPSRAGARRQLLQRLVDEERTLVFYEAPHRLRATLAVLAEIFGGGQELVVARELTKLHEELFRGSVDEARDRFDGDKVRGELVLILPPAGRQQRVSCGEALRHLLAESDLPRKEVVKLVAREYGVPRSDVYRESLKLTGEMERDGEDDQDPADR